MLTTGNQLKAARVLAEIEQLALAALVGVNVNTIRNMEASGSGAIAGRAQTVQAVQRALEAAGVEFLNHGQPGVRLMRGADKPRASREQIDASAADVRSQAASAADEAMSGMDATKQEKADRRATLTDESALVGKARGKSKSKREGH
jgi:transcriptional regulator with XRE-family HTH domain